MKKLNENELYEVEGGVNFSGTLLNALTSAAKFIYNIGQSLGSSLKRIVGGNYCPL